MFGQTSYPGAPSPHQTSLQDKEGTPSSRLFDSFAFTAAQEKNLINLIRRDPHGTQKTLKRALTNGYPRAVATTLALPGAIPALVTAGLGKIVPDLLDTHPTYRKDILNRPGAAKALIQGHFDQHLIKYLIEDQDLSYPLLLQPDVAGDLIYKGHGTRVVNLLIDPRFTLSTQAAKTPSLRLALIYMRQADLLNQLDQAAKIASLSPSPSRFYAQA